jgi:hypothetical protein
MIRITVDVAAAQAMLSGITDGVEDLMVSEQFDTGGVAVAAGAPLRPAYRVWTASRTRWTRI